ncbi:hypothetical protein PYCC9005_005760 [Savitreella phatthalungensis]
MGVEVEHGEVSLDNGWRLRWVRSVPVDDQKQTLVLLHSFLMDCHQYDAELEDEELRGKYNLVSFDLPGHGGCSAPDSCTGKDMLDNVAPIIDGYLRERLGVRKYSVLGTSMGGMLAMRLAAVADEEVIDKVYLLGTSAGAESPGMIERFNNTRDAWIDKDLGRPSDRALEAKAASFGGVEYAGRALYEKCRALWLGRYGTREAFENAMSPLRDRTSFEARLGQMRCRRVVVMHGDKDRIYSVDHAQRIADGVRQEQLERCEIVEGGQHYLSFVQPGKARVRAHLLEYQ